MYLFKPRMLTRESKPNNSSLDSFWWPLTPSSGLGTSLAPAPNSPGVTTFMFLSKNLQMWDTHEAQLRYKQILSNMSTDHEIFINEKSFTSLKTHTLQEGSDYEITWEWERRKIQVRLRTFRWPPYRAPPPACIFLRRDAGSPLRRLLQCPPYPFLRKNLDRSLPPPFNNEKDISSELEIGEFEIWRKSEIEDSSN